MAKAFADFRTIEAKDARALYDEARHLQWSQCVLSISKVLSLASWIYPSVDIPLDCIMIILPGQIRTDILSQFKIRSCRHKRRENGYSIRNSLFWICQLSCFVWSFPESLGAQPEGVKATYAQLQEVLTLCANVGDSHK